MRTGSMVRRSGVSGHRSSWRRKAGRRPACLGWSGPSKLVVAEASRFHSATDVFALLADLGTWPGIRYWSVSKQVWRPLALGMADVDNQGRAAGGRTSFILRAGGTVLVNGAR